MNKTVGVAVAAAILAVIGVVQGASMLGDAGDGAPGRAVEPSATPTVVVVPQEPTGTRKPSGGPSGMPETASPAEPSGTVQVTAPDPSLAEALVVAYYTRSWRDESVRSWQAAVLELGDGELRRGLHHEYGDAPSAAEKQEWANVIADPRGSTRVVDVQATPQRSTEDGHAVFKVEFTVEKKTEQPPADWDEVFTDTWRVEYAWDGERWLAHTIEVVD
mgnify:CR=1 FL=1